MSVSPESGFLHRVALLDRGPHVIEEIQVFVQSQQLVSLLLSPSKVKPTQQRLPESPSPFYRRVSSDLHTCFLLELLHKENGALNHNHNAPPPFQRDITRKANQRQSHLLTWRGRGL